jgi:hypothetical protein
MSAPSASARQRAAIGKQVTEVDDLAQIDHGGGSRQIIHKKNIS